MMNCLTVEPNGKCFVWYLRTHSLILYQKSAMLYDKI